jgi:flavin reductase (DIM6/NTAB) family NADH-FMN oxidoreductase RutF
MSFDVKAFRNVLGRFATGVTIVTTNGPDGPTGITANSFTSVSLSPPLVLFCIDLKSTKFDIFMECETFAINILSADQQDLSNRFAMFDGDRFEGESHSTWTTGAPILDGVVAALDCSLHARHEAGDHIVFIGKVEEFRQGSETSPLIYHSGGYAQLGA